MLNSKAQKAFIELITPEKKNYICVEKDQPFKISMFVEEEFAEKNYGCNLYLDGKVTIALLLHFCIVDQRQEDL